MKNPAFKLISTVLLAAIIVPAWAQNWQPEQYHYEYNAGPAAAGKAAADEILKLYAAQPENKYISDQITPSQKFRYTFGAMMLRTNFAPNSVKIFAIGQDAVDDAELVKLPGTGTGYSTRVQNIANFHGVDASVATSNASFQTIKGQYGAFDHYYIEMDKSDKLQLRKGKIVDNYLWTMMNGKDSPIVTHREKAWEWEIKNNMDSMRLIILFGGASQDAFGEFLQKRGFQVPTRIDAEKLERIKVPSSRLVFAGGNNEFPVLLTKEGKDLFAALVGRQLDYTKDEDKAEAAKAIAANEKKAIEMMSFIKGGSGGSGIITAAQLGGYNMRGVKKKVGGKWVLTNSLKGLKLSDGTVIDKDIAFVASPHPTALSNNIAEASKTVTEIFASVEDLIGRKNPIEPDLDENGKAMINHYAKGDDFDYGRAYLPRRVVPFGAPDSILRPMASADRLGPQVLVSEPPARTDLKEAGVKKLEDIFDAAEIEAAKNAEPVEDLDANDIWSQHSRQKGNMALSDSGPGEEMAKLMVENLDRKLLKPLKAQSLGYFAHYRGTFENPKALILYDAMDREDRNTFRAATGARGQALNGMMRELGYEKSQLVLTTIPAELVGASDEIVERIRKGTEGYREAVMGAVLDSVEVVFADGPMAKAEAHRILEKLGKDIKIVDIERGEKANSGIAEAVRNQLRKKVSGKTAAIPVEHLPWNSRDWERVTSGTVIDAKEPFTGMTYAIVTPNFVANQKVKPLKSTVDAVADLKKSLQSAGIPLMGKPEDRVKKIRD